MLELGRAVLPWDRRNSSSIAARSGPGIGWTCADRLHRCGEEIARRRNRNCNVALAIVARSMQPHPLAQQIGLQRPSGRAQLTLRHRRPRRLPWRAPRARPAPPTSPCKAMLRVRSHLYSPMPRNWTATLTISSKSARTIADPKTAKVIERSKGFVKTASVGMMRTLAMEATSAIVLGRLDHIRRRSRTT